MKQEQIISTRAKKTRKCAGDADAGTSGHGMWTSEYKYVVWDVQCCDNTAHLTSAETNDQRNWRKRSCADDEHWWNSTLIVIIGL